MESRGRRSYYYKKVRIGSKVVSRYQGGGFAASLIQRFDVIARETEITRRMDDEAAAERERLRLEAEDVPAAKLFDAVDVVFRAALEATGHHQHKRGEWRRIMAKSKGSAPAVVESEGPIGEAESLQIMRRAQDGDKSAVPAVRRLLRQRGSEFVAQIGNPEWHFETAMVKHWCGDNYLLIEAMLVHLRDLARELAGPDPSPIERLLARRIAGCWFAVHRAEHSLYGSDSSTERAVAVRQRHVDMTHRRFLSAVKSLALVRRLAVPDLLAVISQTSVTVAAPEPSQAVLDVTPHSPDADPSSCR